MITYRMRKEENGIMEKTRINDCRSYATIANLEKALEKLGFSNDRYIIVWTEKGKVTPIFNFSNIQDGNVMRYACHGFMTIG